MTWREFRILTLGQFGLLWDRSQERYEQSLHGPALVCSVLANINRDKKKKSNPYTPDDFLPRKSGVRVEKHEQTPEQMLALCQIMFGPSKT